MEKDKVSVVVPIYNVENYLEECIESILNQTYSNIEAVSYAHLTLPTKWSV